MFIHFPSRHGPLKCEIHGSSLPLPAEPHAQVPAQPNMPQRRTRNTLPKFAINRPPLKLTFEGLLTEQSGQLAAAGVPICDQVGTSIPHLGRGETETYAEPESCIAVARRKLDKESRRKAPHSKPTLPVSTITRVNLGVPVQ